MSFDYQRLNLLTTSNFSYIEEEAQKPVLGLLLFICNFLYLCRKAIGFIMIGMRTNYKPVSIISSGWFCSASLELYTLYWDEVFAKAKLYSPLPVIAAVTSKSTQE